MSYEMFTPAGERACQSLVNKITKKIQGTRHVTLSEIELMVHEGMKKIAVKHGEVYDTEPSYHIQVRVNLAMKEQGYQPPF